MEFDEKLSKLDEKWIQGRKKNGELFKISSNNWWKRVEFAKKNTQDAEMR